MDLKAEPAFAESLGVLDVSSVAIMEWFSVFLVGFIRVMIGTDVDVAYKGLIEACIEGTLVAYVDGDKDDTCIVKALVGDVVSKFST